MKKFASTSLTPISAVVFALATFSGTAFSQEPMQSSQSPKLRILTSRTGDQSSGSVVFESAGSQSPKSPLAVPPDQSQKLPSQISLPSAKAMGINAVQPSQSQSIANARPPAAVPLSNSSVVAKVPQSKGIPSPLSASSSLVSLPQTPEKAALLQRQAALNRIAMMNSARGPMDAGVPQAKAAAANIQAQTNAALAARKISSTSIVQQANAPQETFKEQSMNPTVGQVVNISDNLASEISREGNDYFFAGTLNGVPVRFRINQEVFGIKIPSSLAALANIIPPEVKSSLARLQEVISPVSSISFGAYQVNAVMAKIYTDSPDNVIDVGLDALQAFKIKDVNGRRLLVKA